jgi:hypothetical protein
MTPTDLLAVAAELVERSPELGQASLRRAVSTLYYALFHALARSSADCLIGEDERERDQMAWTRVYRALDHGFVRNQCREPALLAFPVQIQEFARVFSFLQAKRHAADYDPATIFEVTEYRIDFALVQSAITAFLAAPARDRRAFAAFVLLKSRRD